MASVSQGDLLEIVGSTSGTHSWHARLSDDKKTVVIRPDEAFAFSETVYVTVKDVLRKETGELINGTSFSFETKDAFTSEQAEKSRNGGMKILLNHLDMTRRIRIPIYLRP